MRSRILSFWGYATFPVTCGKSPVRAVDLSS